MNNQQFTILDLLNVLSFIIGLMNLEENLTQGDKQDIMKDLDNKTNNLLEEIHGHLASQDEKIDNITTKLDKIIARLELIT